MAIMRPDDPEKLGNWNVLGRLGEGGFGTVFLGEQGAQKAAIKIIRDSEIDLETRNRFLLEITALSRIDDPYIPRLIDSDLEGQIPWFATEFINGPTLEAKVRYEGPLEQRKWFNLAANVFHALVTIHSVGVIHKDVKPSNIILGETGNKLVDFGIAHVSGYSRKVTFGEFEGSRPFSSPESSTGKNEPRMDVFSAAATLGYAARGKSIWAGTDEIQLMRSINESEPDLEGLTELQKSFLIPLLSKNPSDRPTSEEVYKTCLQILSKLETDDSNIDLKTWNSNKQLLATSSSKKGYVATAGILITFVAVGAIFTSTRSTDPPQNAPTGSPIPSGSSSVAPAEISSDIKDTSPTSKEIQANLNLSKKYFEKKDLDNAMKYARLAADAGNAHGMYDVAYILVAQGKKSEAITWYEKAAKLNYGDAFLNLGALYMGLGKTQLALEWYEKGSLKKNIGSINALGFYYGDTLNDYKKSLTYYLKSAELGDVMGMANAGFAYEELYDIENAKKWYSKASDLGSVDASINLGYLYEKNSDWSNARKYYERAAAKKDPLAMYDLAIVLGNHFGQGDRGCELLNEAIQIKSIDAETLKMAKSAIAKGCSGFSLKSSTTTAQATQSADPNIPVSPSPSFTGSSYSEPLAASLKSSSIFGRAYMSGTDWIIPLTNSAAETVPPINRVQIKDSTQTYGQWWNISYILKNNGNTGWSAIVSDYVLQMLHSTDGKLCPEFRLALVQGGKVTYIWNKTVAPCSP